MEIKFDRERERQEYDRVVLEDSAKIVIGTLAGRLWTNFILENVCRASLDPFHPDPAIHAHNAGRQAVAREIRAFLLEHTGTETLKKLNDQRFNELTEQQISRELREKGE